MNGKEMGFIFKWTSLSLNEELVNLLLKGDKLGEREFLIEHFLYLIYLLTI